MPELPEVEVVRRDLDAVFTNRTITDVQITGLRSVRRAPSPDAFRRAMRSRSIVAMRRHGKFLLADLDDTNVLVMHLRMSGQLVWVEDPHAPFANHTHVRIACGSAGELRFVDPRTFGEMYVTTADVPELAHLGPDPYTAPIDVARWLEILKRRRARIKSLLMDQTVLAGIGNIYSDELLFRVGVRGDRPANTLTRAQGISLADEIPIIFGEAIAARGSTLSDAQYVDLHGQPGAFAQRHRVYAREGEPCLVCGAPIARMVISGRSSAYCPHCQPARRTRRRRTQ